MRTYRFLLFSALALAATQAQADSYKLYSPYVHEGEASFEADLNYSHNNAGGSDHYLGQVYEVEYGVTSWWSTEIGGEFEQEQGSNTALTNYKWENVFAPFKPGTYWLDAGIEVELEKGHDSKSPNNFETKLLLAKEYKGFVSVANIGLSREFGPNRSHGLNSSLNFGSHYKLSPYFQPGFEYYGDFGRLNRLENYDHNQHVIGPVIYGEVGELAYNTGVLVGLTDESPDATLKLNLEYEF